MTNETIGTSPGGVSSWFWGRYSMLGLIVAVLVCAADQIDKYYMIYVYGIRNKGEVVVLPFLSYVFKLNTGISYSMFDIPTYSWQLTLAGVAVVASIGLWIWLATGATNKIMAVSIGMIIGGAIGNGIDRVLLQGVADFYKLHAFGYSWYIFNIADVAIVAGVLGLLYDLYLSSRNDAAKSL